VFVDLFIDLESEIKEVLSRNFMNEFYLGFRFERFADRFEELMFETLSVINPKSQFIVYYVLLGKLSWGVVSSLV